MSSILIGYYDDPHITDVAQRLERRGWKVYRFDPHSLNDKLTYFIDPANSAYCALRCNGEEIDPHTVRSIWYRFKPIVELPNWGPMQTSAALFAQAEWRTSLRALENIFVDALWVNSPKAQLLASSKINQLRLATECGLQIPNTIISNDPDEVLEFVSRNGRVVYKTLEWASFPDQTGVYTTEIDRELIKSNWKELSRAPGIFQKFVDKMCEFRITVVGEQLYVARINTPREGKANIDWRHNIFEHIFEAGSVSEELVINILKFHNKSGLCFGAYDFAYDREGNYLFLECNPAGQFLWIENETSLPICKAVADLLRAEV